MNARHTQVLVTLLAGLLLLFGIALTFLPEETGTALFGPGVPEIVLAVLGGALIGLGYLNWMSRRAPIGGIYGRPVLLANLGHFVVAGLPLLRHCLAGSVTPWLWVITAVYLVGMVFYGSLLFIGPARPQTANL